MQSSRRGLVALIGGSTALFTSGTFIFGFPGVMGPFWMDLFGVGRGAVGGTLFFVLAAVGTFMFVVGRLQERVGLQRMMTVGALICGFDVFLLLVASHIFWVYAWAFLMGVGTSFIYVPCLTIIQRWFPAKRGLVSGVVNFSFGFSGAVMSPILTVMLLGLGYEMMIVILGAGALAVGLFSALLSAPPTEPQVAPESATETRLAPSRSLTAGESLKTRAFWRLWLTWALLGAAGIAMVTLSTQFGISLGYPLKSAVVILTAFNVTNAVSRIIMGWLSDYTGRNLAMSATFFAAGISYFLLPYASGLAGASIAAAVVGFAFGTMFAVSAPLTTDCFGMDHFGSIFGLVFTSYGVLAAPLGPWLSGYVLDITGGNFSIAFGYLGVFCVASAILVLNVTPPER